MSGNTMKEKIEDKIEDTEVLNRRVPIYNGEWGTYCKIRGIKIKYSQKTFGLV